MPVPPGIKAACGTIQLGLLHSFHRLNFTDEMSISCWKSAQGPATWPAPTPSLWGGFSGNVIGRGTPDYCNTWAALKTISTEQNPSWDTSGYSAAFYGNSGFITMFEVLVTGPCPELNKYRPE